VRFIEGEGQGGGEVVVEVGPGKGQAVQKLLQALVPLAKVG
jgi:16S rRNA A1518/A1519 N6-dimethyltransferase RsmA/KsgA/DIM1 with predicted DNA glycosylase/AP lyase activity